MSPDDPAVTGRDDDPAVTGRDDARLDEAQEDIGWAADRAGLLLALGASAWPRPS